MAGSARSPKIIKRFIESPPRLIAASFAVTILLGALLLNLPVASQNGESVGFINALLTATSAHCVTGLIVVNTMQHWALFGKLVILLLIQFGAIGFITVLTLFMILFRRRVSLQTRLVIQSSYNQDNIGGMARLVKRVVFVTLTMESIGAVLLAIGFGLADSLSPLRALWYGVFHSISAFCNAGFDIASTESLVPYAANPLINFTIMALIVAGGLGFTVWGEFIDSAKSRQTRKLRSRLHHFSLHTKLVVIFTLLFLFSGFAAFLALEWNNPETLGPLPFFEKLQAALFQSVTLRTAGFNTISQAGLTDVSKFFSCLLMMIGGAPAGTAGGMKVVTLAVIFIAMISVARGRSRLEALGRTLPLEMLQKALTVAVLMVGIVLTSALVLHFTEQQSPFEHNFLDLLFETSSAAGTVGVTTGITPHLSAAGKLVVTLCMYLGRIGPVTAVVALNMRLHASPENITYPDEKVIIG